MGSSVDALKIGKVQVRLSFVEDLHIGDRFALRIRALDSKHPDVPVLAILPGWHDTSPCRSALNLSIRFN